MNAKKLGKRNPKDDRKHPPARYSTEFPSKWKPIVTEYRVEFECGKGGIGDRTSNLNQKLHFKNHNH